MSCATTDRHGRIIRYLRISVTDRCNMRCWYCSAPEGARRLGPKDLLSFDEIEAVARAAAGLGFDKLRLTGGEPLMRPSIIDLVARLAAIEGIDEVTMTTNGSLLADAAADLAAAGLSRVNVSIDSLDPERFAEVTGGGDLARVLAGVDAARRAGLTPIKLNCVVDRPPGHQGPVDAMAQPGARSVAEYAAQHGYQVRFIPRMDIHRGEFSVVQGGIGGDCSRCDRLRLSSDGLLRPCLFSDLTYSVRLLGPEHALRNAITAKPAAGGPAEHDWMRGIGG